MKNKMLWAPVFLILLLVACNSGDSQNMATQSSGVKKNTAKQVVSYICDISKDTTLLIADSRILLTTNSRKSWHAIKKYPVINQVTLDDKDVLWASYYGAGLQEPGRATLLRSADWGKTWKTFEFNQKLFAPEKIVSNVHEALRVVSGNKVFQLTGYNPIADFTESYSKPGDFTGANIATGYGLIDISGQTVIYKKHNRKKTLVASLDSVGTLRSLVKVGDTLFAIGNGVIIGDYAKPYFSAIVGNKVKRYHVPGHYIKIYKGYRNRIWAIVGGELYLKNDTGLRKVLIK